MVEVIRFGGLFNPNATYPRAIPFGRMVIPSTSTGIPIIFPIGLRVEEAETKGQKTGRTRQDSETARPVRGSDSFSGGNRLAWQARWAGT
jgi:hypothetical protein